MNNRYNKKRNR